MQHIKIQKILLAPAIHAAESAVIKEGIFECTEATADWEIMPGANDEPSLLAAANWDLDGVIGSITSKKAAEAFARRGIPVVTIHAANAHPALQLVCTDYEAEGRLAADFLTAKNYRHFAFFGSYTDDRFIRSHSVLRGQSFITRLKELGFSARTFPDPIDAQLQPSGNQEQIIRKIMAWLDRLERPTAMFCADDALARYIANLCRRRGIRIPEEIALLGAGNVSAYCVCTPPRLSSIETNYRLIGFKAAQALFQMIKQPAKHPAPIIVPPGRVIERDSTGMVLTSDPAINRAIACIREKACTPLRLRDIAAAAGLSARVLQTRFPEITGRTLFDEIRRYRIDRARELLIQTDYSLEEIASRCGFSNAFYLSRVFRKKEGVPPGAYRKQFMRR